MRVFAYCAESFEDSTRRAAGTEPLTCPSVSADLFEPGWLEGYDLLYFDLHGYPFTRFWIGDGGVIALAASQVRQADLGGAVVFAVNCHLADGASPMMDALLDAGASYVIGGTGKNYAGTATVQGAAMLGMWLRRLMALGLDPLRALAWAKRRVRMSGTKRKSDALAFRAFYRRPEGRV